ncbi:hypothetical protein D3C86_1054300 [compost metagenome]
MEAVDTGAAGVVVVTTEQYDVIRTERPAFCRMGKDCRCQYFRAAPVVGNDRGSKLAGKIDIDVRKGRAGADLVHAVGIGHTGNEERIDRIGDQGLHGATFFLGIAPTGDDHGRQAAFARLPLEGLRHRGKEPVVINRHQKPDETGFRAPQTASLQVGGVAMRLGKRENLIGSLLGNPPLAP